MNLFITRNPPNGAGPGGSQRAMHLLRAMAKHGPLDFLILYRESDAEAANDTLDAVRPFVRSCQRFKIDDWAAPYERWPKLPWKMAQLAESLTVGSDEVPHFSNKVMHKIGSLLPQKAYDTVFASRLSSASLTDDLIKRGCLQARRKVTDLDDLISRFKQQEIDLKGDSEGQFRKLLLTVNVRRIRRVENRLYRTWDAVSLANAQDAEALKVHLVPNVTDRPLLPPKSTNDNALLFVGHLSYSPNVDGLTRFLNDSWPIIKAKNNRVLLDVVGMRPSLELVDQIAQTPDVTLHANVASLQPYYEKCDVVIAPIWQGGGTRIKILEAMAYGRPVVSPVIGAEGIGVVPGVHALIADTPESFANETLRLLDDQNLQIRIVSNGRQLQQDKYSPAAVDAAIDRMMDRGK